MSYFNFWPDSPFASMRVLVGVYRHHTLHCKPGMYRVIPCLPLVYGARHLDAVMDDFGNLVEVE